MEKTVHILLADDDYQVLSALSCVIEQEPDWLVTNEFRNAQEMILHFKGTGQSEDTCDEHTARHASILLIDWELTGLLELISDVHMITVVSFRRIVQ